MLSVKILLYGLIALAPDRVSETQITTMKAYLVNATAEQPVDGCRLHRHEPILAFRSASGECRALSENEEVPGFCHYGCGRCRCPLDKHEITFDPPIVPRVLDWPLVPGVLPSVANRNSFGWTPRMTEVSGKPALAIKSWSDLSTGPGPLVVAKMVLGGDELSVCELASEDTDGNGKPDLVHGFGFGLLGQTSSGARRQAIAEAVMVSAAVEGEAANGLTVRLHRFDGSAAPIVIKIPCNASGECAVIHITNNIPSVASVCVPEDHTCNHCEHGVDALRYYTLTKVPLTSRPIPHRDPDLSNRNVPVPCPDLPLLPDCPPPAVSGRPICMIAVF